MPYISYVCLNLKTRIPRHLPSSTEKKKKKAWYPLDTHIHLQTVGTRLVLLCSNMPGINFKLTASKLLRLVV
jgi:hypothetical protein